MIGKCGDVFRPIPHAPAGQWVGVSYTWPLRNDEPHPFFIQDAVIRVAQVARARDGMHENDWQAIGVPGVRPGQSTSIRQREQGVAGLERCQITWRGRPAQMHR